MDLNKGTGTEHSAPKQGIFGAADAPAGLAPAYVPAEEDFAQKMARKRAEAIKREVMHTKRVAEEEDALDMFMDAEVKPTVQATEEAVRLLRAVVVPLGSCAMCWPRRCFWLCWLCCKAG